MSSHLVVYRCSPAAVLDQPGLEIAHTYPVPAVAAEVPVLDCAAVPVVPFVS